MTEALGTGAGVGLGGPEQDPLLFVQCFDLMIHSHSLNSLLKRTISESFSFP